MVGGGLSGSCWSKPTCTFPQVLLSAAPLCSRHTLLGLYPPKVCFSVSMHNFVNSCFWELWVLGLTGIPLKSQWKHFLTLQLLHPTCLIKLLPCGWCHCQFSVSCMWSHVNPSFSGSCLLCEWNVGTGISSGLGHEGHFVDSVLYRFYPGESLKWTDISGFLSLWCLFSKISQSIFPTVSIQYFTHHCAQSYAPWMHLYVDTFSG